MILLSNCPHGNGIFTVIDDEANLVVKSSYAPEGIESLEREHAGYRWYFELPPVRHSVGTSGHRLERIQRRSYARLTVERFLGRMGNPYQRLSVNFDDVAGAIEAYAVLWPGRDHSCALHGDFSLGNIIFPAEGPVAIIDWEHFRPSAAPWGFDLVSLLYECAFFSFGGAESLRKSDHEAFLDLRSRINTLVRIKNGFDCTLGDLTRFISVNAGFWGPLIKKLPVLMFSSTQTAYLAELERESAA